MPKISAPTVAEHHARVEARLVDAAETIIRNDPHRRLTAAAVSEAAGIARNSIYRYVDSIDDLRIRVVERYLPDWFAAVADAVKGAHTPSERIVAWVRANLEQAAATGHGWLMEAVRDVTPGPSLDSVKTRAHSHGREVLVDAWRDVEDGDVEKTTIATGLTLGLLDAGFRQLDAGMDPKTVVEMGTRAVEALVCGPIR